MEQQQIKSLEGFSSMEVIDLTVEAVLQMLGGDIEPDPPGQEVPPPASFAFEAEL
jgi:hypothetical protein